MAPRKSKRSEPHGALVPMERVERSILLLRGQKVMLDADLAELYGVEPRVLLQAVKRNVERFPADFAFQLTPKETAILRSQIVTSSSGEAEKSQEAARVQPILRSQFVISSWGGRRHRPYAFTEQGIAMLSSVLRSERAVRVNIAIMRAFVRLRQVLATHEDLARKLASLERKYDASFKVVFDAIRDLMDRPVEPPRRRIGFDVGALPRSREPKGRGRRYNGKTQRTGQR